MNNTVLSQPDLTRVLRELQSKGRSLLATNFYNYETLKGVLSAAAVAKQPIILQLTQSSLKYMGTAVAVTMARTAMKESGVTGWLHLDHSTSYDLIYECLDNGFDSVMIDASEKSFEENVDITSRVVELAAKYNANVEAELGYVAKLGQSSELLAYTDPEQAQTFVASTGVHALAVAIGTVHGFYKKEPKLDLERLSAIRALTDVPLVLHGGSGIPGDILVAAIKRGICKINLATEIKNIFIETLKNDLQSSDEIDLRIVFPPAIAAVTAIVRSKLELLQ
ncbi:MAG TPA: class II fructose-bisphosphate aldolase [Flavitalea sp.]|nr:class II fructose-bisphosphate aldolase [Flavitalea sp.]